MSQKEQLRWYWMSLYMRLPAKGIAVAIPSEDAARERLCKMRWPAGIVCPSCAGERTGQKTARDIFKCGQCGHHVSVTAGTALHSTNLPVLIWLLAAEEYITRQATGKASMLTNAQLGKFLGKSSNDTVVRIKKKLIADLKPGGDGLLRDCVSLVDQQDFIEGNPSRDAYDALVATVMQQNFTAARR